MFGTVLITGCMRLRRSGVCSRRQRERGCRGGRDPRRRPELPHTREKTTRGGDLAAVVRCPVVIGVVGTLDRIKTIILGVE